MKKGCIALLLIALCAGCFLPVKAHASQQPVLYKEEDCLTGLFHKNGIEAWMAPYDIPAGCEYAEVIADALAGCACLVLVLTAKAQDSVWVAARESNP